MASIINKVVAGDSTFEHFSTNPVERCNMRCQELDYCIKFTVKTDNGGCQLLGRDAECIPAAITGYDLYSRSDYRIPNEAMK